MKRFILLMIVSLAAFISRPLEAEIPSRLNFQGRLLDANKNPRNGNFSMTFRICATESASCASPLWNETQTASVANGVFAVQLGSITAITSSVFSGATTYLEIDVAGETLSPRERLVAAPYAFRAQMADDVAAGSTNYIQLRSTLQSGATFYVSSGAVANNFIVGGVITAGSGSNQITTTAGLLDATKLTGLAPNASIDSSSVTKQSNVFNGANQLVQLNSTSQLPAVSAAFLTNIWPSNVVSSQTAVGGGIKALSTTESQLLQATINLSNSTNRVLILASSTSDSTSATDYEGTLRVRRGTTNPDPLVGEGKVFETIATEISSYSITRIDSPATVGDVTYSLRALISAGSGQALDSSLILIEIGP